MKLAVAFIPICRSTFGSGSVSRMYVGEPKSSG